MPNEFPADEAIPAPTVISGTSGTDRLRGTAGDDFFEAFEGDDTLKGGDSTDTAILSGSIWDYEWNSFSTAQGLNWTVTDMNATDGDTGTDTLESVERLQFNDATISLGVEEPLQVLTELPTELRVTVGGSISFDAVFLDFDDLELTANIRPVDGDLSFGRLSRSYTYGENTRFGESSISREVTFTYDGTPVWGDDDPRPLAEGEAHVEMIEIEIATRNIWLDGPTGDGSGFEYTSFLIPLYIIGVNDAPTIAGSGFLRAFEDGGQTNFNLAGLGSDIDSDDDGTTLTYEIVSVSRGIWAHIDGTNLVLDPANLENKTTSDEKTRGTVEIRAVDRHGTASAETVTIDVLVRGIDDTPIPPNYLTAQGDIDYAAIGIDPATAPDYGELVAWSGYSDPNVVVPLLTGFSKRDDILVMQGTRLASFDKSSAYSIDGVRVLDKSAFVMGRGDDVFAFSGTAGVFNGFESNDVITGRGEDVIVVDLEASGRALINGARIFSGMQSDRVLMHAESSGEIFLTGQVNTGTGHDIVDLRVKNPGSADQFGALVVDEAVYLGSGNDKLTFVAESVGPPMLTQVELRIDGGSGNDEALISTRGLGPNLVLSATDDPTGIFYDLYRGGIKGSVWMGGGDDRLTLDMQSATNDVGLSLYGDLYHTGRGDGYDILVLQHLTTGAFTVSSIADAFGQQGMRIVDGYQTIDIYDFEEIWLGDGSELLVA